MKKLITLIALVAIAGVATADLVDGSFSGTAAGLESNGIKITSHLNDGWVFTAAQTIVGGAALQTEAGKWGGNQYAIGQVWEDATLGATDRVTFDVTVDGYSASLTDARMRIEIFGISDPSAWASWEALTLNNSDAVHTGITAVSIMDELVDIQAGVGSYSTAAIDLSGYGTYAIRISTRSPSDTSGATIQFDNVSIGSGAGPAPESGSLFVIK